MAYEEENYDNDQDWWYGYEQGGWYEYGADEQKWYNEQQQVAYVEEDTYPWGMWTLIYDEMKLQEDPNIIHEACMMLQEKQIHHPWQLKQLPRTFLESDLPRVGVPDWNTYSPPHWGTARPGGHEQTGDGGGLRQYGFGKSRGEDGSGTGQNTEEQGPAGNFVGQRSGESY